MKFFRYIYISGLSLFILAMVIQCSSSKIPQEKDGLKLVWNDEFNGKGLPDSTKWNYDVGGDGYGNNEAQFYTKERLENARMEDGNLIIEAKKEPWEGSKYTSARLLSRGKYSFKYGTIEVRAKLPKGRGTWPAIWMMSENMKEWPDDGEIDIMEHVGFNHGFVHGSIHTKKYNHIINTQKTDTIIVNDVSEKFHVYKMNWTPDKMEMFIDDQKYFSIKNEEKTYEAWPFDQPFFIILNQAVGGNWGGQKGIDDTIYPQKFYIDYVRVYQNKQSNQDKTNK